MKLKLISLDPVRPEPHVVVKKLPALLGRSPDADVYVDDRWVSRRHCEIDQLDGTLVVRDVGSKHGTFVNGECVNEVRLLPGDRLTLGVSSYEVQYKRGRLQWAAGPGGSVSTREETSGQPQRA